MTRPAFSRKEVEASMADRYLVVPRHHLPEGFEDNPTAVLDGLVADYKEMACSIDPKAAIHHDWAVRVGLDAATALVPPATVAQANRWVEFRGVVGYVRKPFPKAAAPIWSCSRCSNVFLPPNGKKPAVCERCGSDRLRLYPSLKAVGSQLIRIREDAPDEPGMYFPLDCLLEGALVGVLSVGDRCVVGGVLRIVSAGPNHGYLLMVNNVEITNRGENRP